MPTLLTYHHLGDPPASAINPSLYVPVDRFDAQLRRLRAKEYRFLGLDELRAGLLGKKTLPRRSVVLTFDDGFADNYEHGLPLLKRHGARAAFFITTGRIGSAGVPAASHMTEDQIRQLAAAGMDIGSHGVTHRHLGRLDPDEARGELVESKAALERILGRPVRWLCYPSGNFNRSLAAMAKEAGYVGACSVIRDNRVSAGQMYWLPRAMVMRDTTPMRFAYYFSWLYHFVHHRKNLRRWKDYL